MSIGVLETKNIMPNLQTERTETNETYQQKKIVKPTNGTNMPNLQTERTETNETYQQKKIMKPTNGTNMPNLKRADLCVAFVSVRSFRFTVFCLPTLAPSFHLSLFLSSSHGSVATQHRDVNRSAERSNYTS